MHVVIEKGEGGWYVALRDFLDAEDEIPLFEGGLYAEGKLRGFSEFFAALEEAEPDLHRDLLAQERTLLYFERVKGYEGGGTLEEALRLVGPFVLEGHVLDRRQEALIPCENSPGCEVAVCGCGARVHSHGM